MPRKYIPNEKEKYMCEKHKVYFKKKLVEWKNEIIKLNSEGLYLKDVDHEISSPDVIDQAASQTEKNVEMRTLNRQIKLVSKIEKAIKKIEDNTYGYCEETNHKNRLYNIAISNDQSIRNFVMTIIHEMIHVKQYVRNEWVGDGEKEAWNTQERLTDELWRDDIL